MNQHRIYQLTSIGRPVDPGYPTNRAVLIILPFILVIGILTSLLAGAAFLDAGLAGLRLLLVAFVGWALARELAPDDEAAAFVAMAIAAYMGWKYPNAGILIAFATMAAARVVNRTTGLPARLSDSFIVIGLTFWVVYATDSPFFALVAVLAFALDGTLKEPVRRHWLFAMLSVVGLIIYVVDHDVTLDMISAPDTLGEWLLVLFLVMFLFIIVLARKPSSLGDIGSRPLSRNRVRGGMMVALLAVLQGIAVADDVVIVASSIAGVCLGVMFRKAFSIPTPARAPERKSDGSEEATTGQNAGNDPEQVMEQYTEQQ